MIRWMWLGGVAACGSSSVAYCERLDECNALVGQSVNECADVADEANDALDGRDFADCQDQLDFCADTRACDAFLSCSIDSCGFVITTY